MRVVFLKDVEGAVVAVNVETVTFVECGMARKGSGGDDSRWKEVAIVNFVGGGHVHVLGTVDSVTSVIRG